ncbi:MAG: class I SAM-dependent methyltransferase [Candidatus Methanoperedens sp.]
MTCNYCKGTEHEVVAEYTRLEKNDILKCKNCGLVYLDIKKNKKDIESFYSLEYRKIPALPVQSAQEHYDDKVTQHDSEDRISFISNHFEIRGKKILEIGSASGSLLNKLSEYGAKEVVGIELSEEFAEFSRNRGFKIFTDPIEELDISQKFDIVVSFHTIEHVFDPMAVFKGIYKALKPDGWFLGEVPNQNDWRIKIFDDKIVKRFHYDPNHYYYFSPETLKNHLKTSGFNDIRLETVERYNSIIQLRNILCHKDGEKNIEEVLNKYIFPKNQNDEVRLPAVDDKIEGEFNRIFGKAMNSELIGNCLRWIAYKK